MYLMEKVEGEEAVIRRGTASKPFGPGFVRAEVAGSDRLEIWGSSFNDPGPDFCEFRFYKGAEPVVTGNVPGY